MTSAAVVALVIATIFVWGVFSARLDRADLSAPIVFVIVLRRHRTDDLTRGR